MTVNTGMDLKHWGKHGDMSEDRFVVGVRLEEGHFASCSLFAADAVAVSEPH